MTRISGVAVAGIGETGYFKRGTAPYGAIGLCVQAVLRACEDAGLDPHEIDGFCSHGDDRNEGIELAAALGCNELRWSSLVWGGGGGGLCGALAHAAAAIISGQARHAIVLRGHAEAGGERLMTAVSLEHMNVHFRAHGVISPTQVCALRAQRLLHEGVPRATFRALAQAGYYHAANNPGAVGRDIVLSDEAYDDSRMIAEPYRLFDCSRENDGAGAVLLTSTEEARTLRKPPVHLSAVAQSQPRHWGPLIDNDDDYTSAGFRLVAERLWNATGLGHDDVDVTQVYENVSGAAVAALIDHGFCTKQNAGEVLTLENLIAPDGTLAINTSGGSIAEGFVHGIGLTLEAVRQIRGESCNQVPDADVSLLIGGPVAPFVSSAIFTKEAL
jgi:acetyl-CoA acetyltransferase